MYPYGYGCISIHKKIPFHTASVSETDTAKCLIYSLQYMIWRKYWELTLKLLLIRSSWRKRFILVPSKRRIQGLKFIRYFIHRLRLCIILVSHILELVLSQSGISLLLPGADLYPAVIIWRQLSCVFVVGLHAIALLHTNWRTVVTVLHGIRP